MFALIMTEPILMRVELRGLKILREKPLNFFCYDLEGRVIELAEAWRIRVLRREDKGKL